MVVILVNSMNISMRWLENPISIFAEETNECVLGFPVDINKLRIDWRIL